MPVTAKRNAKDTVFKDFFSRPENLIALYRVLHPEDSQVTEGMLSNITIETDVLGQYVRFCKVFNMETKEHGLTEFAIQETIRICKNENVLRKYLEEREREVTSIMLALFNEENIQKAYGKEKYDEGRAEGRAEGESKGANLMAKLAALLVKDGKLEAIVRASTDEEYRNKLIREYQLS